VLAGEVDAGPSGCSGVDEADLAWGVERERSAGPGIEAPALGDAAFCTRSPALEICSAWSRAAVRRASSLRPSKVRRVGADGYAVSAPRAPDRRRDPVSAVRWGSVVT